jgi:Mg-chelatase subunit ChlI
MIMECPAGRRAAGTGKHRLTGRASANRACRNGGGGEGTLAMAESDSGVEVRGTVVARAATNGSDPDAIVAQIERTRENLAQTIDTLADKVSPAGNARRLRERAAELTARPEVRMAAAAVGLAVVGLAVLRIWGRRRK